MSNLTTKGIEVSVKPIYDGESSFPDKDKFVFSYHVMIQNNGNHRVKLVNRHWIILDADNVRREVKGPGVIGEQPVLLPGDHHSYKSFSVLRTPIGKMYGKYEMMNMENEEYFEVRIPAFKLIADYINN